MATKFRNQLRTLVPPRISEYRVDPQQQKNTYHLLVVRPHTDADGAPQDIVEAAGELIVGRVASHDVASGRYHIEIGAESGGGGGGPEGDGAGGAMGAESTSHWLSVKRDNAVL